jgi:hypothetical protein
LVIAALVGIGAAFVACEGPRLGPDVGIDASPSDSSIDARLGTDAPDAHDAWSGPDAGPWPPFEPRIIWADTRVTCTPLDYTFEASPPPATAMPGDVLWQLDLARDEPTAWRNLASHQLADWGTRLLYLPMTITRHGGLIATKAPWDVLSVDGDGHWVGSNLQGAYEIPPFGPDDLAVPQWMLTATPSDTFWGVLTSNAIMREQSFDPTGAVSGPDVAMFMVPDYGGQPGRSRIQSVGVLADGTVVWAAGNSFIVGSCADGRNRWIVETPTRDIDPFLAPHFTALRDGTVLAHTQRMTWHLGGDGAALGHTEMYEEYVEGCGLYREAGDAGGTRIERLSEDLVTILPTVTIGATELFSIASNCDIWTVGARDPDRHATARRFSNDGALLWSRDYSFLMQGQLTPLADDGLLIGPGQAPLNQAGMAVIDASGTVVAEHSFAGDPVLGAIASSVAIRPDGVAIVGTDEVSAGPIFTAIHTGTVPGRTAWFRARTTWARNGAVWMLPPP